MRYSAPELLEGRIAPATLVNPTTVTFFDVDGDLVTVKATSGTFTKSMFQFLDGDFDDDGPQQLSLLDISAGTGFNGASISFTAKKVAGGTGDGLVNVGGLIANVDLKTVTVSGDLGRIVVGGVSDGTPEALGHLKVGSLGARVFDSQGLIPNLVSVINGNLDQLSTSGDLVGRLEVSGRLETARIGGDIEGFLTEAGSGVIFAQSIGSVNVIGDITGLTSGAANGAGIHALTSIGKITIGGGLKGGGGVGGAFIYSGGTLGSLSIAEGISGATYGSATVTVVGAVNSISIGAGIQGSSEGSAVISTGSLGKLVVKGDISGGANLTARIEVTGDLGSAKVTGILQGSSGGILNSDGSAVISATGNIGKIVLAGVNGGGDNTARIASGGAIGSITVLGNLDGGNPNSGTISADAIKKLRITGDVLGGADSSATISANEIGSVLINGSVQGSGAGSASIYSNAIDRVVIKGNLSAGADASASIFSEGSIGSVLIGGYVQGSGSDSARIAAEGDIGKVRILKYVQGASEGSASIYAEGKIGYVSIGEDLRGGGSDSATIIAEGTIGKVAIGGNLQGAGDGSASIISHAVASEASPLAIGRVYIDGNVTGGGNNTAAISASQGSIGFVSVGGVVQGGGSGSASIHALDSIKSITIKKTVGFGAPDSAQYTAGGNIGKVTIGENFGGSIHAGSLGRVTIGTVKAPANLYGGPVGTGVITAEGDISSIVIYGNVQGGDFETGIISAGGDINSIKIDGTLSGGNHDSGNILVGGDLGRITIGHLLGNGFSSNVGFVDVVGTIGLLKVGSITSDDNILSVTAIEHSASVRAGRINSAVIGDITSGATGIAMNTTTIEALNGIGSLTVTGSITGTANNPVVITAAGQATPDETKKVDLAIGKVNVGGDVNFTNILAGYSSPSQAVNADAQIGAITIAGALNSSNIVAGAAPGIDNVFGTSNDTKITEALESTAIISRIASIKVGSITASAGQFGIVAEEIGSLKIGGVATVLAKGKSNDLKTVQTGTVLRELGLIPA